MAPSGNDIHSTVMVAVLKTGMVESAAADLSSALPLVPKALPLPDRLETSELSPRQPRLAEINLGPSGAFRTLMGGILPTEPPSLSFASRASATSGRLPENAWGAE